MDQTDRKSNFLSELVRRRVLRSAAAYIVFAWVAIQVASIVFPEFGAPQWSMRALILFFIVAFPPAMLAAWTVDVSESGIVRTRDSTYKGANGKWPRLTMVLVTTAMSASVLWWAWDDYIVQPTLTRGTVKSEPVIAVNAPQNLVGQSDSDWLGDGVATMIRSTLAESSHVIVLSQSRWIAMTAGLSSQAELLEVAQNIGVDYIIDGNFLETPDGIVLTTRIEDVENGIEIQSSTSTAKDISGVIASVPELGVRIKRALNIPHKENVGMFEADFAIENIEAYEAYIAGLAYWIDFEYGAAEEAFDAALTVAPDYHIARFRLAQVYESTGRSELALSTLGNIPADANLSQRLRLYVEGAKAYFVAERDPKKAIEIYSQLVELYPYEMEAGTNLAEAYWLDFQDAAMLEQFRRLTSIHPHDPASWKALGERLLEYGEFDEANVALKRYTALQPDDAYAYTLFGQLAMLQGNLSAAVENHEHALSLRPGFVVATIGMARSRYLLGEVRASLTLWQSVIDNVDMAAKYRIDVVFDAAGVLRGQGQFEESLKPITDTLNIIEEEGLRLPMALSQLGSTHYEVGNTERAQNFINESIRIAQAPITRYLFAQGMLLLRRDELDGVTSVVQQIRSIIENSGDTDPDGEKAANYLAGLVALRQGELSTAESYLNAAVDLPGYQYAIYTTGLAMLYRATGDLERASELAGKASTERDLIYGDLRLDLELDRARAQLLYAEILAEQGASDRAREEAQKFLDRWQSAAPDLPEMTRAQALLDPH